MRSTVIAAVLAIVFIAVMFALPEYLPRQSTEQNPAQIAAQIEPGFTGVRQLGPWTLACNPAKKNAALPLSMDGSKSDAASVNSLGRCRAFIAFRRKADPRQVVLLVNVRLVGPSQRLAFIVRTPPILKKGDLIALQWGKQGLGIPVVGCEKSSCVAIAGISPKDEAHLMSLRGANLVFPPNPNGKRFAVGLPFIGLRAGVGAMRRAETGG